MSKSQSIGAFIRTRLYLAYCVIAGHPVMFRVAVSRDGDVWFTDPNLRAAEIQELVKGKVARRSKRQDWASPSSSSSSSEGGRA